MPNPRPGGQYSKFPFEQAERENKKIPQMRGRTEGIRNDENADTAKRVSSWSADQLSAVDKGLHAPGSRVPFPPIRWLAASVRNDFLAPS